MQQSTRAGKTKPLDSLGPILVLVLVESFRPLREKLAFTIVDWAAWPLLGCQHPDLIGNGGDIRLPAGYALGVVFPLPDPLIIGGRKLPGPIDEILIIRFIIFRAIKN